MCVSRRPIDNKRADLKMAAMTARSRKAKSSSAASSSVVEVVTAVIRRTKTSSKFSLADCDIVLGKSGSELCLPTAPVQGAETTYMASNRIVTQMLGMGAIRSHRICARSAGTRVRNNSHVISIVYFVLTDSKSIPISHIGVNYQYYNMDEVLDNATTIDFAWDHREVTTAVSGWLRQLATMNPPKIDQMLASKSRIVPQGVIANPLMSNGLISPFDGPVFSHNNNYFKSGVLKPEHGKDRSFNVPRNTTAGLGGIVDLDVVVDPYDRAADTIRSKPAEPSVTNPSKTDTGYTKDKNGKLTADDVIYVPSTTKDQPKRTSQEPLYSESTKIKRKPTTAADKSPAKPILEDDDDNDTIPVTTWFNDPTYSEVLPISGNDDDVADALNGLRNSIKAGELPGSFSSPSPEKGGNVTSPDYPERKSVEIPDTEHPFLDDLKGDFSNPLFVN